VGGARTQTPDAGSDDVAMVEAGESDERDAAADAPRSVVVAPTEAGTFTPTDLVRIESPGGPNVETRAPSLSADGSAVAFVSRSDDGAPGGSFQRVWLERDGALPSRVDVALPDVHGAVDGDSSNPVVSADGALVAFRSASARLVEADTNAMIDAFVAPATGGAAVRISQTAGGIAADRPVLDVSLSPDGKLASFSTSATNLIVGDTSDEVDAFSYFSGTSALVSPTASRASDGESTASRIAADGALVFVSSASNLLGTGGDTNGADDVFLAAGSELLRLSVSTAGAEANGPSREPALGLGVVVFTSWASNLISTDGNRASDVFLRDQTHGTTERVSVGAHGEEPDGPSHSPSVSADGRYVAFVSAATNLVDGDDDGDDDVFVRDRQTARTTRASVAASGAEANAASGVPVIAADGHRVAFESMATNLGASGASGSEPALVPGIWRVFRVSLR
jgi:hypothetical protein